jgi:hypothetical protein
MYCLGTDGSGGVRIVDDAGPRWDHATDRVSGTYACQ